MLVAAEEFWCADAYLAAEMCSAWRHPHRRGEAMDDLASTETDQQPSAFRGQNCDLSRPDGPTSRLGASSGRGSRPGRAGLSSHENGGKPINS